MPILLNLTPILSGIGRPDANKLTTIISDCDRIKADTFAQLEVFVPGGVEAERQISLRRIDPEPLKT
jgi:hypothetical protein